MPILLSRRLWDGNGIQTYQDSPEVDNKEHAKVYEFVDWQDIRNDTIRGVTRQ